MENKKYNLSNYLKFIMPSLIGVILFICPIKYEGQLTIPIAILSELLMDILETSIDRILVTLVLVSFLGSALYKIAERFNKLSFFVENKTAKTLFKLSNLAFLIRGVAAVYVIITWFFPQVTVIASSDTGGLVFYDLLPILFTIFFLAGICLPLLLNFGLLEFVGTLLIKVMRPVFGLPGRSAVDAIASWLGDGTIGVMLTSKQYEEGYYTEKEACVIGTNFSLVSITFSLVVINTVGLGHMFLPFYLTVTFACIIAAIVIPKLPPLSNKRDELMDGTKPLQEEEEKAGFSHGVKSALEKVKDTDMVESIFVEGIRNVLDMWIGVIPIVMMVGTTALIIAEYTPVFRILGIPFVPVLELLQIPEAQIAAQSIFAGFADMLLPSVMVADTVQSELTRFVVAAVSVSQLIYLSEVGALLLASKIPVKIKDLLLIFIERTLITLPIIAIIAHIIF